LVSIERSFQGLSIAIETMRIDEELIEIWPNEVCDKLILSSSYVGSSRFMTQLFQDAIAICRYFHKVDLFLITANPKWPEILHNLFPGQTATNYLDIIS